MPDRSWLSTCRCCFLFVLIILIFSSLSCSSTPDLSVEDAKKIIVFEEHGFTPPPPPPPRGGARGGGGGAGGGGGGRIKNGII